MEDEKKTKRQLIEELNEMRQCVAELKGFKEEIEQARLNQEKFTKAFLQNSIPVGITTLDEGIFVEVNNTFLILLKCKRDEVVGYTSLECGFITEEQRTIFFNELNKRGRIENLEMKVRAKDGAVIDGLFNAVMMTINNEKYLLTVMIDVTARKQAEEALHRSETKFRTLYDSTSDAVMLMDEKNFFDCNKATLAIFGCETREKFYQKHPAELSPPQQPCGTDSIVLVNQMIATAMEKGSVHFEWMLKRNDTGETFPADVLLTAIEMDGKPVVQALVRDITERKLAEEKSQNMLNFLQTMINTIPSPIFCKDINGSYQDCNKEFEDYTGFKKEELIGKGVYDMYPKDVADKYHEMDLALFRQPGRQIYEHPIIYADGNKHDVVVNKATYLNTDGTLGGLVGVMVDITERKRAEEALQKTEQRFRAIFNSSFQFTGLMTPDGMLIEANQTALDFACIKLEDIINQPFWEARWWRGNENRVRQLKESISRAAKGEFIRYEVELQGAGDTTAMIDFSIKPVLDQEGEVVLLIPEGRDISNLKQAEEEKLELERHLQHAQKLESIGTLAGGIAHNFNNLLMGIQGYASLSLMNLDPSNPIYERLRRIEEQVQSGADLTRQLLGFARGGRYYVKPTDMNDIIEKTSSMFGRTQKEISIHRKYGENLSTVEVDQGQMEQVFMNLYVNAWQAMSGGGELHLETGNVMLGDDHAIPYKIKPGRYVKASVTDTGTGMDERTRERIFDPFFTTKAMGRGTGLGLAMVYGIIKGHGGMIDVASEPGRGTTFIIYLPASENEVVKEKKTTGTIARGTETILVVDDEKMVLDVSKELLESMGYRIYAAGSGQEAIAVYMEKRNEIDLVILDMIMPGISGEETFDRLREINAEIKVLLSSGYSIDGQAQEIMDRGCNGFIQKPFQLSKLSSKVREMLD